MRVIISLLLIFVLGAAHAEEQFPDGCKPLPTLDSPLVLHSKKLTVFLLHNLSDMDVWITHPVNHPSASAGWSSRLQAGKWSALALQSQNFELTCIESKPGHEQQVACSDVLAVCHWGDMKMPDKTDNGTFWVGEDKSLMGLIGYMGRRGFAIPDSDQ